MARHIRNFNRMIILFDVTSVFLLHHVQKLVWTTT